MDALDGHLRGPSAARQLGSPPPPSSSRGPSDTRHVAEYVPVDNDHVSAGNEDVPIDSDHVSVGNEDVPVDSDHLPIGSSNQGENKTESCGDEGPTAGSMDVELHIAGIFTSGGKGVGRRALIEYVMLAGVNDTEECGRELGELLKVSKLCICSPLLNDIQLYYLKEGTKRGTYVMPRKAVRHSAVVVFFIYLFPV